MERDFDSESRGEKLWNTPAFENKAMRPPRDGIVGEQVFAEFWEKQMADTQSLSSPPNGALSEILGPYPFDLDQRCATVAASLVTWFGTNCGLSFLHEAKTQAAQTHNKGDSYLRTWAVENARKSYSGSGARTLEHCLKADADRDLPELSGRDYEVAEHVVFWLASEEGQDFVNRCEVEIEARRPEANLAFYLQHNLKLQSHEVRRVMDLARKVPPQPETLTIG
jgi:hypothetical protein